MDLVNSFIFSCHSTTENKSPSPSNHSHNVIKFSCRTPFLGLPARHGELSSVFFGWVKSFRQLLSYLASSWTRALLLKTLHFILSDISLYIILSLRWLLQYFKIVSLSCKKVTLNTNLLSGCFLSAMHSFPQNRKSTFQLKLSTDFLLETFETLLATSATQSPALFLLRMMFLTCQRQLMWIKADWFSCCLSKRWDPSPSTFSWFAYSVNDAILPLQSWRPTLSCSWQITQCFLLICFPPSIPILN